MRLRLSLAGILAFLAIAQTAFPQTSPTNQPLQVKEGWWTLHITNHMRIDVPEETLKSLPPASRKAMLDKLKADEKAGLTYDIPFCLTHEHRLSGIIFFEDDSGCSKLINSDGQKLQRVLICGDQKKVTVFQKVSAESFTGTQTQAATDGKGGLTYSNFSAKFLAADCGAVVKAQNQAWLDQSGFDKDVLAIMPYIGPPGHAAFGPYFVYTWGVYGKFVTLGYHGGIPWVVTRGRKPEVRFHGTDGTYVYLTVEAYREDNFCVPPGYLIRLDKTGNNPTQVKQVPPGLHGGERPPDFCPQ